MDKYYRLINREHPLPENYIPDNLVDIGLPFDALPGEQKRLLEEKAAYAVLELISRSRREGLNLYCISGYRSYKRQAELYAAGSCTAPPEEKRKTWNGTEGVKYSYVAAPGTSEHQSGLALDLSCPAVHMELTEAFAETKEGIWLSGHAPLYGFILRYPKNKEPITGIPYEPWHIRYVTKPLASYLAMTGLTLEEYHAMENPVEIS